MTRATAKTVSQGAKPTPLATPTPTPVDYHLVYPGILPDHLLYPLKMIRDRAWFFFTTDPVRKAELCLLFADKRLGAAQALIEGGKADLGVSTLTKGEKYLEQTVGYLEKAKKEGKKTADLTQKLEKAMAKHLEVLGQLSAKVSPEQRSVLEKTQITVSSEYEKIKASGQ